MYVLQLPAEMFFTPIKSEMNSSYERNGFAPNIYSKNLVSDITMGIDKTLEEANDELK